MQKLTVQSDDLEHQSTEVQRGAEQVNETLTRLGNQITQLASNWGGGASDAFRDRWDEWQKGARDVQQAMDDMAKFLHNAADTYAQTEDQIKSAAGR